MISIGKTVPMINQDWGILVTIGGVMEQMVGVLSVIFISYLL